MLAVVKVDKQRDKQKKTERTRGRNKCVPSATSSGINIVNAAKAVQRPPWGKVSIFLCSLPDGDG